MDTLRLACATDARAIADIYAPSVVDSPISFELVAPTEGEMAQRIADFGSYAPWLVLERAGEICGFAYASRHQERPAYQWSVNASVYVHPKWCREGVGRRLYESLFALLDLQGFVAVHAGITLPNPASVGLHEAMGFRPVGVYSKVGYKAGAWHDVGWWQLRLRELPDHVAPSPPRTMTELQSDAAWDVALRDGFVHRSGNSK